MVFYVILFGVLSLHKKLNKVLKINKKLHKKLNKVLKINKKLHKKLNKVCGVRICGARILVARISVAGTPLTCFGISCTPPSHDISFF